MPGRVDQVELIGPAVASAVVQTHRLRLDRDASLALEIHRVEHLRLHLAAAERTGEFEQAIRQGRLAVVDMGDDRKIADQEGSMGYGRLERRQGRPPAPSPIRL